MSYMTLQSGACTGAGPGSTAANAGGLRMLWELRFYTSAETVTILGKSYACAAGSYKLFYKLQGWYGVEIAGKVRLTDRIGTTAAAYVSFRSGSTALWTMPTTDAGYAARNPSFGNNSPKNSWYDVGDASYSDAYRVYPSGLIAVSAGATLSLNLSYSVGLWYNTTYHANASATSASATVSVTGGQSAIASLPAAAETNGSAVLGVTRWHSAYWHKASFRVGSTTLWTSEPFETSLSFAVPRSWFDGFPDSASLTVTVSLQTYADRSCTSAVGTAATRTMTVTPDAGMAPVIGGGFASAAPDNTGTAAAGMSGYVQGFSRARVTLDPAALTLSHNAAAASYTVICGGESESGGGTSFTTGTLSAAGEQTLTIRVTDSRGLTASTALTLTVMPYAEPTLTGVEVFRCLSDGTAGEDGACVSVRATGNFSSLGGQNSLSLTAQTAVGDGGYGAASALTGGVASVLGGTLDPDRRLSVRVTATDALGNAATALRSFPTRAWAMKFRADGQGVAFGKAPEHGAKKLELPADWELLFGAESFLERVYPVGSLYLSTASADPGTLFGGVWARIEDRFLLAAGTVYAAGDTGGEAAHTLTESEMPNHTHALYYYNAGGSKSFGYNYGSKGTESQKTTASGGIVNSGGGQAHNNLPPYLAVYVWRRTA